MREINERKRDLDYDQSLKNPRYLEMNPVVNTVKAFFDSISSEDLDVYDFGCGQKPYEVFFSGSNYIGIDIDRKNNKADVFADITKVPVRNEVADLVCSFFVLEHVYNPEAVLKEKYRVLRSGGRMFMLVPLYGEEHEQPYDYWRFTQFCLRAMLEEMGFVNIGIKPISATWSILGLHLVRVLNSRKVTRLAVPLVNRLCDHLDRRNLNKYINQSNVMAYAVVASKD